MPATTDLTTRATELLHELAGPDAVFREHQLEAIADLVDGSRARAVRAAHRLGQVGRLLRRHGAAARARRRPDADRLAAARAHAQPDRRGRSGWGSARRHGQLDQPRRVGRGRGAAGRRRRRRPAADQPRAAEQPAVPRARMLPLFASSGRAARRRRGALHLRLGPRLPAGLPAASRDMLARLPEGVGVLCTTATANDRVVADVEEQLRTGHAAPRSSPTAARSGARACASRSSSCPARPTGSPGWRRTSTSCRARGSSTR